MKINWGTGIVIRLILFIGFILVMVFMMSTEKKYNYDLVTEEYYKEELKFQEEINAENNTFLLSDRVKSVRKPEGLVLIFPKELENNKILGTVFLYRPSNKRLDFEIPLELKKSELLIPKDLLLDGRWNIIVRWRLNDKDYLFKEKIRY
jgi:cbb3-type cytochrome oxidase subunit 3